MGRNTHTRARKISPAPPSPVADPEDPRYFSVPAIHGHYNCGCAKKCRLNLSTTKVDTIEVQIVHGCDKHLGGQLEEVIFGDQRIDAPKCPRKSCDCTHVTTYLSMEEFNRALLWAEKHQHNHVFHD